MILKFEGTGKPSNGAQYQCDLTLTIGDSEIVDFRLRPNSNIKEPANRYLYFLVPSYFLLLHFVFITLSGDLGIGLV